MIKNLVKKHYLFIFAIISLTLFIPFFDQTNSYHIVPAQDQDIKWIIFDLGGVFFGTDSMIKCKLVLNTLWNNPSLLYYVMTSSVEEQYFTLLHSIPALSKTILYHKGQPMPQIMADWQVDATETEQIQEKINNAIMQSEHPNALKNFFRAIAEFMFNPKSFAASQQSIPDMIQLAKELKNAGYKIYALSNWDKESFKIILKQYPEVFEIFDHFLISGYEKMAKPAPEFFQKLIDTYQINPSRTIFIDDELYNLAAASKLGIQTIHCSGIKSVLKELKKFGITS